MLTEKYWSTLAKAGLNMKKGCIDDKSEVQNDPFLSSMELYVDVLIIKVYTN